MSTQPIPNCNHLWLQRKRAANRNLVSTLDVSALQNRPGDAQPISMSSVPFVAYPAPGAAAVNLLVENGSPLVVPQGFYLVVESMAISHWGGGVVDGSGNVIWRVLRNDAAYRGLGNLTSQFGAWQQLQAVRFFATENDLVQITVEVPAAMAPMPPGESTSARIVGYLYPIRSGG